MPHIVTGFHFISKILIMDKEKILPTRTHADSNQLIKFLVVRSLTLVILSFAMNVYLMVHMKKLSHKSTKLQNDMECLIENMVSRCFTAFFQTSYAFD